MREYEKKMSEPKEYEHLKSIKCDICGTKGKGASCGETQWENQSGHNNVKTAVFLDIGSLYPDGGESSKTFFDICPDCFKNKLMSFLKSLGATPQQENYDF